MAIARHTIKPGKSTNPEAWRTQGELLLHRGLYQDVSCTNSHSVRLYKPRIDFIKFTIGFTLFPKGGT